MIQQFYHWISQKRRLSALILGILILIMVVAKFCRTNPNSPKSSIPSSDVEARSS